MKQLHEVHEPRQRLHVMEKLMGRAVYGADIRKDGMLYAKGVCLGCASAEIHAVLTAACREVPGVVAVYTAKDLPGKNGFGLFSDDEPILADRFVKFTGDVVALVVAETQEAAEAGARMVQIDCTALSAVLTVEDALHPKKPINPGYPDNICAYDHVIKGNASAALETAGTIVDEVYTTSWVEHAYIEPEVMCVLPTEQNRLEIRGATQHPFFMRQVVCSALAIPESRVVVHPDTLGGSFGGKVEISAAMAARAALAVSRLHRPVLYVLSREESITQSHKRHGIRFHVRLGADARGTLQALEVKAQMDAGAYVNESPIVAWKTVTCGSGPYEIPNVYYENKAVLTNNLVGGAMRGFGTPQAIFAMESAMNELAQRLGISPLELRRRNFLRQGSYTATNHRLVSHAVSIADVMERAAEAMHFEEKFQRYSGTQTGHLRRGVGIACSIRGVSFGADSLDQGRARLLLCPDGTVELLCPMMEMGQGADTVLSQICADALQLPLERVHRRTPETDESPDTGAAGASRGTFIGGNSILLATAELKGKIAALYQVAPSAVLFRDGVVCAGDAALPWDAVYAAFEKQGSSPSADGSYAVSAMPWTEETCQGDAFVSYTYSCHCAEVEVNTETGQVRVIHMTACHDAGRIINPQMAAGQVSGGIAMGIGMALFEKVETNPKTGVVHTRNFDSYLLPTMQDSCTMEISFLENPDDSGPFGCKSLGEPAMEPAPAAILGAVNQALGNAGAVRRMPADLETVFFAAEAGRKEAHPC